MEDGKQTIPYLVRGRGFLVEYADLVTEMREIKHPFREQGIGA